MEATEDDSMSEGYSRHSTSVPRGRASSFSRARTPSPSRASILRPNTPRDRAPSVARDRVSISIPRERLRMSVNIARDGLTNFDNPTPIGIGDPEPDIVTASPSTVIPRVYRTKSALITEITGTHNLLSL
jgi:hypothetical protein